jgi:hypothetical protein
MDKEKDTRTLVQEYLLHEGDNITQRIDWSLIFQGILLEALFASPRLRFSIPILSLGLAISALWLVVGFRQNWTMTLLTKAVTDIPDGALRLQAILKGIRNAQRKPWYGCVRAVPVFTIVIPSLTFATWLALFVVKLITSGINWYWSVIAPMVLILGTALLTWAAMRAATDHDVRKEFVELLQQTEVAPNKAALKPTVMPPEPRRA